MTAVIYARYSSDSQREASIEGQLRDCKDYAEKNGITVVGTYIDRAYSAKTDDRPDFQRMIKDSGKKIFDVVLVWKLDRFARNRFDAVNYKYQLEKNGVHLVSAMEPISQGPEGIMVESMLIGMAEYYSAELALKVARGERENALQCKYNGGVVPLGFTIGKEDRLYHIDPETAPIVQEIFTRYADGEPAEKIAASLNERGLRTRTGKPFVKNSFFQIFRNRRYIGEYRYKDIVTPGGIPAIVDQDLFDRVQQRFEQNRIAHGRPAKEDVSYLLTTKLFCGKCGTLMGGESGTSHMGNTYYYYKCGNAKRHGKAHCDLKAIRKEPLERFVVETAIKVIFSDEIIERLIDLVMEAQQKENTRLPVLKDQLRDTEKRLANLLEAIEQGILTPTTKQRLDELEARKEALNTSILEEELKKPVLTREWIRFWLEKFRKGDVGSTEHQRQIIDTFVNSVYVFDDRVVLNFNFTDDAKTVTREEVLGSSAVDNAPPCSSYSNPILYEKGFGYFFLQHWDSIVLEDSVLVKLKTLFRTAYNFFNRIRLKNTDVTLIASNCNGCCILHDLGLKFNSPFVNLWIEPSDFIKLCENLKDYLQYDLVFITPAEKEITYPVALLNDIKLYFQHYSSEEEAALAWNRRKGRINFDNLYFLFTDRDGCTKQNLLDFDQLNLKHKAVLCHKPYPDIESAVYIKGFESESCVGMCMRYRSRFSIRKYYDDFDYVAWFNQT